MDSVLSIWKTEITNVREVKLEGVDLASALGNLGSSDPAIAFNAIRSLTLSPSTAVTPIRNSIELMAKSEITRIDSLVQELDQKNFQTRKRAADELAKIGEPVRLFLWQARQRNPSEEHIRQIEKVAERIPSLPPNADYLRMMRAIETLEWISDAASLEACTDLGKGHALDSIAQRAREAAARISIRLNQPKVP